MYVHIVVRGPAAPGVALEVDVEADDVVNPVGRYVQEVARLKDHLVALNFLEIGELLVVRFAPVYLAVSA